MAKILNRVKMSEPVLSTTDPKVERKVPPIEDAKNAVIAFLKKTLNVKQVNVTKLAQIDSEKGTWEAEVDVFVPNQTIKSLGLPIQKEVLDCESYILRLDDQLNTVAYGIKDLVEDRYSAED